MGNVASEIGKAAAGIGKAVVHDVFRVPIGIFENKPQENNDTMREIERREREIQRREAEAERRDRERAAAREREEAALLAARQAHEEAARQREEAVLSAAKGMEEAARQREEAALAAVKQIEAAAKEREEAARAEAEEAKEALEQGIRPVVMPTPAQIAAAKERIQYDPEKLHFAVCGASGSGKSSFVNAVRGLGNYEDRDAARVGVVECTSEVTQLADPRNETPYSRFVWFDIPGAGTGGVPDWQYFNDQGLFVFDFIVMLTVIRFTLINVGIVENCLRFKIPVFIVRSKADQHIENMMKDKDCEPGDEDYLKVYQESVKEFVEATRLDFDQRMESLAEKKELDDRDRELLLSERVYIVSGATVRGLLQSKTTTRRARPVDRSKIIDEPLLVVDMLRTAARARRYPGVVC